MLRLRIVLPLAIITGVALELGIHALSGRREAWDSDQYWTIGAPIALALAFALGRYARGRAWLGTAAIVPAQMTAMLIKNGEMGPIWPVAMILATTLGLPFVGAAFLGRATNR
jgi:hypothetical protein